MSVLHRVESRIDRVRLYSNGALVTRVGDVPGEGRVELHGLPLLFSSDSLRLRPSRGRVGGLEESCALTAAGHHGDDADELMAIHLEAESLGDRIKTLRAILDVLDRLAPGERPDEALPTAPDPRGWLALTAFSRDRAEVVAAELDELVQRRVALKERHAALKKRQSRGGAEGPRFLRGVVFDLVDAAGEGPVTVEVDYFTPAARWSPTWRLDIEQGRASLALSALVAQASGESWDDVELSFATHDLERVASRPELLSWRLGRAQAQARPAFRPLPGDLEDLFAAWDRARASAGPTPQGPAPAPRAPPRPPRPSDDDGETDADLPGRGADSAEGMYASFEDEATNEYALSEMLPLDQDSDTTGGFRTGSYQPVEPGEPPEAGAGAPPLGAMSVLDEVSEEIAYARDEPEPLRRRAALPRSDAPAAAAASLVGPKGAFRGAPGAAANAPEPPPPPPPPPPRLRYAYFRLEGPESPRRGQLWPLDPLEHLGSLVEDHDVSDLAALRRAARSLEEAARRLTAPATAPVPALADDLVPAVFTARARYRIPGDGQAHRVRVSAETAPARMELRAVPRFAPEVFRTCLFEPARGSAHPSGPLSVWVDGEFRVQSHLDGADSSGGAGRTLELNLGVEPGVVLERVVHVHQEEKGLVSQTSRVDHEVTLQVRSSLADPARLVIFDRVPVPDDNEKDIHVEVTAAPEGYERTDRDPRGHKTPGAYAVRVDLGPRERREIALAYRITLPAKAELWGGNRRE